MIWCWFRNLYEVDNVEITLEISGSLRDVDVSGVLFGRGCVSKKESLGRNATLKTRKSAPESLGPRWKTKLSYKLWGFKVDMMMQLSFIAAQRRNPKKCQRALQSGTLLLHDVVTSGLLKSTLYRSLKEMSKSYNHQDPLGNQHPSNQTLQSLDQVFSPPMLFFVLVYWGVCSGWMRILLISCTGSWLLQNITKPGFYVFFQINPSQLEKFEFNTLVFFQLQKFRPSNSGEGRSESLRSHAAETRSSSAKMWISQLERKARKVRNLMASNRRWPGGRVF